MLQKCANPSCSAPFRSLREGKLFVAESLPPEPSHCRGSAPKLPRREHFWLCDQCAAQFTLRFDAEHGMLAVPIGECAVPRFLACAAAQGA